MSEDRVLEAAWALVGRWRHAAAWDSDDYLAEYQVTFDGNQFAVSGHDLNDGEKFQISDVSWDGATLRFRSLMPSTRREGLNEFRALSDGSVESRFTFTVVERMVRHET
jgi:hypothetical protein